jgi:hypothetical protein
VAVTVIDNVCGREGVAREKKESNARHWRARGRGLEGFLKSLFRVVVLQKAGSIYGLCISKLFGTAVLRVRVEI